MRASKAILLLKEELRGFVANPFLEAELLIRKVSGATREEIYSRDPEVSLEKLMSMVKLRKKHYPLQYIIGEVEFYSRKFLIKEGVFIPRAETEVLVEFAVKNLKRGAKVIEVGSGSGVISITLSLERPDLGIFADDISPKAIELSLENQKLLGSRVQFLVGDCLKPFRGKFDAIVSNPPYVAPGEDISPELAWEPEQAYLSPPDGLSFIKRLVKEAREVLRPHGLLIIEISPGQADFLREKYSASIVRDLSGKERVAAMEI